MTDSNPEPEGPTLAEKVAAAMSEAAKVEKGSRNTEQGYNFASAEAILAAVRAPLLARGVLLIPSEGEYEAEEIQARSGTKGQRVTVTVTFRFTDGRDELLIPGWRGVGQDFGDKAAGKAYTNALKTLIRTAWLLPTEHDDPERSSPGENVGASPTNLPGWARPSVAPDDFTAALEKVLGPENATKARTTVEESIGSLPAVAVSLARLVGGLYAGPPATPAVGGGTETLGGATRTVAQAGGHQAGTGAVTVTAGGTGTVPGAAADGVTDDTAAFRAAANPEPPGDEGGITLEEARQLADKPAPGTVKAPENLSTDPAKATAELKAAGCSCPSPISAQAEAEGIATAHPDAIDKGCAIHGIPF